MYFDWTQKTIERPTYDSECIPFVSYHPSGHLCPRYPPGDCLHESRPYLPSFSSLCSSTLHPPLGHPQDCDARRSYLDQELVQILSRGNGFICPPSGRFAPHPPLPSRPSRLRTTMLVTSAPTFLSLTSNFGTLLLLRGSDPNFDTTRRNLQTFIRAPESAATESWSTITTYYKDILSPPPPPHYTLSTTLSRSIAAVPPGSFVISSYSPFPFTPPTLLHLHLDRHHPLRSPSSPPVQSPVPRSS